MIGTVINALVVVLCQFSAEVSIKSLRDCVDSGSLMQVLSVCRKDAKVIMT